MMRPLLPILCGLAMGAHGMGCSYAAHAPNGSNSRLAAKHRQQARSGGRGLRARQGGVR
jgi:hypothetical protein